MELLKVLRSLFAATSDGALSNSQPIERASPFAAPGLAAISADLDRAAALLLHSDQQSLRTAIAIVQEASSRVAAIASAGANEHSRNDLLNIEEQLRRTRQVAEGAMRIHWTNLRRVLALTQSYAPPGKLSQFKDRWTRIDLKV